jgi:spermidine/putrescine transport system permease protein
MISPVTIWVALLVAVPLIYVLALSFCQTDSSRNVVFRFTLANYGRLFDQTLMSIYLNSIIVSALTTICCILIGYPFSHIMARSKPFSKTLMMVFLMLPFWTNSVIRLYGWRTLLGANGYVNTFLLNTGLVKAPLEMLYNRGAVVFGMVYTLLPFMALPIHTSIDKLDLSLLEASSDLGAKPKATFLNVTLPLTAPGIFAGTIMVFIPSLGYFFVSDLLGGGTSQLIGNVIERQFKESFNWPFGAALSIVLIALTLLMVKAYTKTGGSVDDLGVM